MIEPVICALTTPGLPAQHEKGEDQLGRVAERDVEQAADGRPGAAASCSVARRIHSANGITPRVAVGERPQRVGPVSDAAAAVAGTSSSSHANASICRLRAAVGVNPAGPRGSSRWFSRSRSERSSRRS